VHLLVSEQYVDSIMHGATIKVKQHDLSFYEERNIFVSEEKNLNSSDYTNQEKLIEINYAL